MKISTALVCAMLLAGLGSCASPYASEGITGGYHEEQIQPDVWRVRYAGNGYTTADTVQTFWLYRCAEITLEHGYGGFQIISPVNLVSLERPGTERLPAIKVHGGGGGGHGGYYGGGVIYMSAKPWIEADIRMLKPPFAANPPTVFDAAALKALLEPLVKGEMCNGNVCPHSHEFLRPTPPTPPATHV